MVSLFYLVCLKGTDLFKSVNVPFLPIAQIPLQLLHPVLSLLVHSCKISATLNSERSVGVCI